MAGADHNQVLPPMVEAELKTVKETLEESEIKYRALVECAQEGIGLVDPKENLVFVNPAFAKILGYKVDELIGMNLEKLTTKEEFVKYQKETEKRKKGQTGVYETIMYDKNGRPHHLSVSAAPLYKHDGSFKGTIGVVTDITKQKKAEEDTKRLEERYNSVIESAGDSIFLLDTKGQVIHTNKRALVLNEIDDQNSVVGKIFSDVVLPRYKEIVNGYVRKSLLGMTAQFHYETVTPKRHHRWWEATLIPIRGVRENVVNILSISRDLTIERESRAKVGFYKEYAENILASVPISIVVINRSGQIIFANRNFVVKMRVEKANIIGRKLSEIMPADIMRKTGWRQQIMEVIKTRDIISGQKFEYGGKSFVYNIVPMREAIGKRYNVAIMMEDVTDRVALEKQLQHSERLAMMGQFAAGVTHEINNPLAIIKGNVQYLREQIKKGTNFTKQKDFRELKGMLATVEEEAVRCADIISNLLHFAKESDNRKKTRVDINHIVRHVIHIMGRQLSLKNIKIVKELAPGISAVRGSHDLLQQAVMNLVLNAEQAIARRGTITIKTLQNRRYVYIVVKDNGCGIPKELLRFVFDPFFTTKGSSGGTGLGLSVVHTIAEEHGGTITVKSVPKRGSTFTIALPIS